MTETVTMEGVEEVVNTLTQIAPRHARNLMRATNLAVAKRIAAIAKENAEEETGTLKKAIKAKRRKSHRDRPLSEVIVTHGNNAKHDAYYWRFREYGTAGEHGQDAKPFIGPAADMIRRDYPNILREEFGKKLEALLRRQSGV